MARSLTIGPFGIAGLARAFSRADIEFHGLDHAGATYEGRVFVNLPDADAQSPRDVPEFAGCFHIFGHGGCFGDARPLRREAATAVRSAPSAPADAGLQDRDRHGRASASDREGRGDHRDGRAGDHEHDAARRSPRGRRTAGGRPDRDLRLSLLAGRRPHGRGPEPSSVTPMRPEGPPARGPLAARPGGGDFGSLPTKLVRKLVRRPSSQTGYPAKKPPDKGDLRGVLFSFLEPFLWFFVLPRFAQIAPRFAPRCAARGEPSRIARASGRRWVLCPAPKSACSGRPFKLCRPRPESSMQVIPAAARRVRSVISSPSRCRRSDA